MLGREVARRLAPGRGASLWSDEVIDACATCDTLVANLKAQFLFITDLATVP